MAPIGSTNVVQLKLRDSFAHDPFFSDCWSTLERQRDQFKRDCHEMQDKILGNTQLKSMALLAPSSLPEYVKLQTGNLNATSGGWTLNGHEDLSGFTVNVNSVYMIIMDVHQFNPYAHGLSVKTSNQEKNVITIEGGHKEKKEGHGTIARHFIRKCVLPFNIKLEAVQANLSADGVLLINLPLMIIGDAKHKRELMTVDGRKLEESDVDLTRLDSKKAWNGNGDGVVNRDQLKNWDTKIQTLPDFDMVPFWCRKYSPHYQEQNGLGIQNDLENYRVLVDVKPFLPEEVSVRCTDQFVIVEGNQELKQDPFGSLSRQFTRKYELPSGVKAERMSCNLSAGILQIKAPKPKPRTVEISAYGTKIPITMSDSSQSVWRPDNKDSAPAPANQRVYVPPRRATVAEKSLQQTNGRTASDDTDGEWQSPIHTNGDAHSERTIIPFVAPAGN